MFTELILKLDAIYPLIKENSLTNKHFKHRDVKKLIDNPAFFNKEQVGTSVEGREIFQVRYKGGPVRILLWSQMHGDEACATAAFFDIFNFLSVRGSDFQSGRGLWSKVEGRRSKVEGQKSKVESPSVDELPGIFHPSDDGLNQVREEILSNLSLCFIPMLNPDGAERGIRENALGIDLNRDAKDLISPESGILSKAVENFKPRYAFNMHDQDYLWSVGDSDRIAALSFLAPPFDADKSLSPSRQDAVNLISLLYNSFNPLVDFRTTKYSDDFEPRAFGDTIAGKNVSTILIESGLWKNDPDKLHLRKMNFMLLIFSFYAIAKGLIPADQDTYNNIPYNGKILPEMD